MHCNVCSSISEPMAQARILNKYTIQYFACKTCGFIQTEKPYWLSEAYAEPIVRADIGLIRRNMICSNQTSRIIPFFFNPDLKFLDYRGGNGMLVRMMRDKGFDFYWFDQYTRNMFAQGFEGGLMKGFELVTAFEVFEHLPNPLEEIEQILQYSQNILFSTLLLPERNPSPDHWWYYSLDGGQHISFYSRESLQYLADKLGLFLFSDNSLMHILTTKRLSEWLFRVILEGRHWFLLSRFIKKRKSLLEDDYFKLSGKRQ